MATSQIVITIDKEGKEDISIENLNVNYLPYLLGRLLGAVLDDHLIVGKLSEEEKYNFKVTASDIFEKQLGINRKNRSWISLAEQEPEEDGLFLCKQEGVPAIYHEMRYDRNAKMFGTKEGIGYDFITHWYPYPKG